MMAPSERTPSTSSATRRMRASRFASGGLEGKAFLHDAVDRGDLADELAEAVEFELACRVAERAARVGMRFDEEPVDPGGGAGAGERQDELGLPSGAVLLAPRKLDRMRGVENHRIPQPTHDRERPDVDDEIVVPEGGSPLGEEDSPVAGHCDLL